MSLHRPPSQTRITAAIAVLIVYTANFVAVASVIKRVLTIDNDKGIQVFVVFYSFVFILDIILGIAIRKITEEASRTFFVSSLCLVIMFFPVFYYLTRY